MKKKLIIGALALTSILAFAQETGDSSSETERRPMFGSETTGWGPCNPTGEIMADGTPVLIRDIEVTTYVFWIGFSHIETEYCN